jgi:RNA exonuclease 4
VGQISLVDEHERVLCNFYVRPEQPVVSYLTPLTGLSEQLLVQHGMPLAQAVAMLLRCLPHNAILVGQNIAKDVQWLGLKEGQHFEQVGCGCPGAWSPFCCCAHLQLRLGPLQMMDLTGLFRVWNPQYNSYSVFGQDHLAKVRCPLSPRRPRASSFARGIPPDA